MTESRYVHGYTSRECNRLTDQANTLSELLHHDTVFAPGSLVLECGCGTGAQTVFLASRNPDARIVSVDVSAASLDQARRQVEAAGHRNVEFLEADIFDLPLAEERFDHVFLCFVLEHLAEPSAALSAVKRVRRALELGPNNSLVHARYSLYLKSMGRFDESLREITRAMELSPLDSFSQVNAGAVLGEMHRYGPAMERFQRALELAPNQPYVHERLGTVLLWQHRNQGSHPGVRKSSSPNQHAPEKTAWLTYAYAVSGNRQRARELLAELNRVWQQKREYLSPMHMAFVYIGLHDNDAAMRWLDEAYKRRDEWLVYIHVYPEFDSLRSDPRFQELERRIGLTR